MKRRHREEQMVRIAEMHPPDLADHEHGDHLWLPTAPKNAAGRVAHPGEVWIGTILKSRSTPGRRQHPGRFRASRGAQAPCRYCVASCCHGREKSRWQWLFRGRLG